MLLLIGAVSINTFVIDKKILNLYEEVDNVEIMNGESSVTKEEFYRIFEKYRSYETYFSLTVNHDDLTNIEDGFAELIGNLEVDDTEGAEVIKNRLLYSLEHLRRLSGINIDSII